MTKVLVSGASGFLALHIIGQLLQQGYSVVGTVRSQSKADNLFEHYKQKYKHPSLEFVIVPDISILDAFDYIFKKSEDIKYVIHTASPFSFNVQGNFEDVYRTPAVDGTLNILNSILKFAPQVSKVVLTSSMAAIEDTTKISDSSFVHDESVWNPIQWNQVTNEDLAYVASKKLAEKAAWDFMDTHNVKFKLNTINPPYIFGPQFFDEGISLSGLNTSSSIISELLTSDPGDTSLFDKVALCAVDVRDAAAFHIFALDDKISDQRLFPVASRFSEQGILNIINENFSQLHDKIAKGKPEDESKIPTPRFNNEKTKELVGGYEFIPLRKQVIDAVDQILNNTNYLSEL